MFKRQLKDSIIMCLRLTVKFNLSLFYLHGQSRLSVVDQEEAQQHP